MRWKFTENSTAEEQGEREGVRARIRRLWSDFERDERELRAWQSRGAVEQVAEWWDSRIAGIHSSVCWECGGDPTGPMECAISPDSAHALWPLVEEIVSQAPRLPNWEVLAGRPAIAAGDVPVVVQARSGISVEDWSFGVADKKDGFVALLGAARRKTEEQQVALGTILAAECLLGERRFAHWIGEVDAVRRGPLAAIRALAGTRSSKDCSLSLSELGPAIDALINQLRGAMSPDPLFRVLRPESDTYTLYKAVPEEQDEYPRRTDIAVGNSARLAITQALEQRFFSERFSRCGESFCYIKLELPFSPDSTERRGKIELAVDDRLRAAEAGCVFGGASGMKYAYIDLALTNPLQSWPGIREALQRADVSRRSWLLFADADLEDEWLGAWPDSPPPPSLKRDIS